MQALLLSFVFSCLQASCGFPFYVDLIPNGRRVQVAGRHWGAVGHEAPSVHPGCLGRFRKNHFGQDFVETGMSWNAKLCHMDSDFDGRSNGEELGDPHCSWKPGLADPKGPVSHPGIDERAVDNVSFESLIEVTRTLHIGERVRSYAYVRHTGTKLGGLRRSKATRRNATVLKAKEHEVVILFPSGARAILPRMWIFANSSSNSANLSIHHSLYEPPMRNLNGQPMLRNASSVANIYAEYSIIKSDNVMEKEWLHEWHTRSLVAAACSDFKQEWLPAGALVFFFVNLVVPVWVSVRWWQLQRRNCWPGLKLWKIWAVTFIICDVGISAGHHRLFAHCSFKARREVKWVFALLGQLALHGDAGYWAALHRTHHSRCDRPGDPHSPLPFEDRWSPQAVGANATKAGLQMAIDSVTQANILQQILGFFHAHGGFVFNDGGYNFDYQLRTPDLDLDPDLKWLTNQGIMSLIGLPLLSHALFGIDMTLFYLHIPQFLTWHAVQLINSWTHIWGYAPYDDAMVRECTPKNAAWLLPFGGGEMWHNNHHARPESATFQVEWWELDPAFYVIRALEAAGLVWDVRRPPRIPSNSQTEASSLEALKVLFGFLLYTLLWWQMRSRLSRKRA